MIDVDAPEFLPPGAMPARIAAACRASGQRVPDGIGAMTRCVLESLWAEHAPHHGLGT